MKDEYTYVKPFVPDEENSYRSEGAIEEEYFSEKGQIIDQGKTYQQHDLFQWTFRYDNGRKRAEGQIIFAQDTITEPFIIDYSVIEEFSDTYLGIKIGKWTYWSEKGKKIAIIDYQLRGNIITEKVLFGKRRK